MFKLLAMGALLGALESSALAAHVIHTFKKVQLTDKFWAEGASFGDFNHDGKMDIVSGPFWYEGPDFKKRHEFAPANTTFKLKKDGTEEIIPGFEGGLGVNNAYSETFFVFTYDFNRDAGRTFSSMDFQGRTPHGMRTRKAGRDIGSVISFSTRGGRIPRGSSTVPVRARSGWTGRCTASRCPARSGPGAAGRRSSRRVEKSRRRCPGASSARVRVKVQAKRRLNDRLAFRQKMRPYVPHTHQHMMYRRT